MAEAETEFEIVIDCSGIPGSRMALRVLTLATLGVRLDAMAEALGLRLGELVMLLRSDAELRRFLVAGRRVFHKIIPGMRPTAGEGDPVTLTIHFSGEDGA